MRKITKLLLAAALLIGAVSVEANDVKIPIELTGAIEGVTVTPIDPLTLDPLGEVPEHIYAAKFTTSDHLQNVIQYKNMSTAEAVAQGCDRIVIEFGAAVGNAWRFHSYGGQFDGIKEIGGETSHTLMLDGDKAIDDFTIFNWLGSGVQEIIIKAAYFYKSSSVDFEFDAYGKGTVDKSRLTATGGLTYDPSTGVLSSDGTAGSLILEFTTPVDMRNLFQFNVTHSGSTNDILSRLEFYDEDDTKINTWNSIKLSNTWNASGIDDNATNAFLNNKPVKKMVWPSDANASNDGKTATISSVAFTCKTIACATAGETQLKALAWNKMDGTGTETPNWNMNVSTDTYYGNYSSDPTHYADLTAYEELRIYRDNNDGFRAFFINAAGNGSNTISHENDASTWNAEGKYWSVDLSKIEKWDSKVALKSIKSASSGTNNIVKNIVVYNTPAANAPKYILTGSGMQLAETVAALADATATSIDATGVTGITTNSEAGRTLLTSANPNCLILGTTGIGGLANTQNVVTSGTCANLVLTDGHPFKAPADFTATAATYSTTINEEAGAGTLCLPFAAAIPEGVTAYTLSYTGGDKATATAVETTIEANKPVLLNGSGAKTFKGSSVDVDADATNTNGSMTGVFVSAAVPTGNYVLQNGESGIGFYKVEDSDPITINPFRAYLTASAGVHSLTVDYQNGEETGIQSVDNALQAKDNAIFDLSGRRVVKAQKGIYIVNGKKIVK